MPVPCTPRETWGLSTCFSPLAFSGCCFRSLPDFVNSFGHEATNPVLWPSHFFRCSCGIKSSDSRVIIDWLFRKGVYDPSPLPFLDRNWSGLFFALFFRFRLGILSNRWKRRIRRRHLLVKVWILQRLILVN